LNNQNFAEKIRVAGCRPNVPVGEASSPVLAFAFQATPIDEERLAQVFLAQLFSS